MLGLRGKKAKDHDHDEGNPEAHQPEGALSPADPSMPSSPPVPGEPQLAELHGAQHEAEAVSDDDATSADAPQEGPAEGRHSLLAVEGVCEDADVADLTEELVLAGALAPDAGGPEATASDQQRSGVPPSNENEDGGEQLLSIEEECARLHTEVEEMKAELRVQISGGADSEGELAALRDRTVDAESKAAQLASMNDELQAQLVRTQCELRCVRSGGGESIWSPAKEQQVDGGSSRHLYDLQFSYLEMDTIDQPSFRQGVLDGLGQLGASTALRACLRIRLRPGSVVAELHGPEEVVTDLRSLGLETRKVSVLGHHSTAAWMVYDANRAMASRTPNDSPMGLWSRSAHSVSGLPTPLQSARDIEAHDPSSLLGNDSLLDGKTSASAATVWALRASLHAEHAQVNPRIMEIRRRAEGRGDPADSFLSSDSPRARRMRRAMLELGVSPRRPSRPMGTVPGEVQRHPYSAAAAWFSSSPSSLPSPRTTEMELSSMNNQSPHAGPGATTLQLLDLQWRREEAARRRRQLEMSLKRRLQLAAGLEELLQSSASSKEPLVDKARTSSSQSHATRLKGMLGRQQEHTTALRARELELEEALLCHLAAKSKAEPGFLEAARELHTVARRVQGTRRREGHGRVDLLGDVPRLRPAEWPASASGGPPCLGTLPIGISHRPVAPSAVALWSDSPHGCLQEMHPTPTITPFPVWEPRPPTPPMTPPSTFMWTFPAAPSSSTEPFHPGLAPTSPRARGLVVGGVSTRGLGARSAVSGRELGWQQC